MRQKTAFEFQVGDVVRLVEKRNDGVFRVAEQVHWKDDPDNYCTHVTNLDGSPATPLGVPDGTINEFHFELDPFLTAIQKRKQQKTKEEQSK